MTEYRTLDDIDEAERLIRERAERESADLATTRERLAAEAEQARREAARARVEVLEAELIPAAIARGDEARQALADMVRSGDNPLLDALLGIAWSHLAVHALRTEAQSMASTAGLPERASLLHAGAAPDLLQALAEELRIASEERRPVPMPLPRRSKPVTHEDALESERAHQRDVQSLGIYLGLHGPDVAALSADEFAAKVSEANAEKQRRDDEANQHDLPSAQAPRFRGTWGR